MLLKSIHSVFASQLPKYLYHGNKVLYIAGAEFNFGFGSNGTSKSTNTFAAIVDNTSEVIRH